MLYVHGRPLSHAHMWISSILGTLGYLSTWGCDLVLDGNVGHVSK